MVGGSSGQKSGRGIYNTAVGAPDHLLDDPNHSDPNHLHSWMTMPKASENIYSNRKLLLDWSVLSAKSLFQAFVAAAIVSNS